MVKFPCKFFITITLSSVILTLPAITKCENFDSWVLPDPWSISSADSANDNKQIYHQSNCNPNLDSKIVSIYYKKLIKNLFNREKFVYNEKTESYHRNIKFIITKSQLDKLEEDKHPRDLGIVVDEVLLNLRTFSDSEYPSLLASIWNRIKTICSIICSAIFSITKFRFELLMVIVILLVIYIKRMYGIRLTIIIIFGMLFSGYIYKYFECNRNLEIDQITDYHDLLNMPCSENKRHENSIWNLWGLFSSKPSRAQCLEYLRKKNKLRLPFCRPDEVFFKYINEIILNQFQMTVEKSTSIFKEINESIPFPYNIVAVIIFFSTLVAYLQLSFKYILSPHVWSSYLRSPKNQNHSSTHHGDKISGDNLKLFLEILKSKKSTNYVNENNKKVERVNIITSGIEILAPIPSTSKDKSGLQVKVTNDRGIKTINLETTVEALSSNKNDTVKNEINDIVTVSHQNIDEKNNVSNDVQSLLAKAYSDASNNEDDVEDNFNLEEKDDIVIISSEVSVTSNEDIVNVNNIKNS